MRKGKDKSINAKEQRYKATQGSGLYSYKLSEFLLEINHAHHSLDIILLDLIVDAD